MSAHFSSKLLKWFDAHGRKDLPWQTNPIPYRVWLSEIMLQQTQVAAVIPYFHRFIERFPSIDLLANANEDEVMHQWTGLGYYARARNLRKAAIQIREQHNGELPMDLDQLIALPGIGRSTAGAILSICDNQPVAILDGNVKRVLARAFAIDGWPGTTVAANELWQKAEALTPKKRNADYTQAIMDLGAILCTRSKPKCDECPFEKTCMAKAQNRISELPGKKPKKVLPSKSTTMFVIQRDNAVYLQKRPSSGLWGGLWSFPEDAPIETFLQEHGLIQAKTYALKPFRHTFTHFHLEIAPICIQVTTQRLHIRKDDQYCWYNLTAPAEIGLTKPVTKILASLPH